MKDADGETAEGDTESAGARYASIQAGTRLAAALSGGGGRRLFVGTVLTRPWFDTVTLFALRHLFFPASRLLAAADEARGDIATFLSAVPLPNGHRPTQRLKRALAKIERARATSTAIDAQWERMFFQGSASSDGDRVALEAARIQARHALNSMRWRLRLLVPSHVPAARMALVSPASAGASGETGGSVSARAGAIGTDVTVSRSVPTVAGIDYWLRFRSPSDRTGDIVTARVHEPKGAVNPPTIIFGHGVCVDFDHWVGLIDESVSLVAHGFRVIRPEAPWHGRRTPRGAYAGERTISTFPVGIVDSMQAAVSEWGVLAQWARANSRGALAFGGSSLGAMTAQLAAAAAKPDALFLVTHTADMTAVVLNGALSSLWADPKEFAALGWTPELARTYLSCLDAPAVCPVPADRLVSVIGRRDTVLPFRSGREQLDKWGVPAANIFEWDRGHFTVPATMIRSRAPLQRLARIMR